MFTQQSAAFERFYALIMHHRTIGCLPQLKPWAAYLPDPFFYQGVAAVQNLAGIAIARVNERLSKPSDMPLRGTKHSDSVLDRDRFFTSLDALDSWADQHRNDKALSSVLPFVARSPSEDQGQSEKARLMFSYHRHRRGAPSSLSAPRSRTSTCNWSLLQNIVQLQEVTEDIDLCLQETEQIVGDLNRTAKQLQNCISQLRMRPFSDLVGRFPRALRELSLQYGKEVDLKIHGGDTLVDRSILDALNDPLMHLLRNALCGLPINEVLLYSELH